MTTINKGYNENELATVKGLQGMRHFTFNKWQNNKLITLCKKIISPNYRDLSSYPNCSRCRKVLRKLKKEQRNETMPD